MSLIFIVEDDPVMRLGIADNLKLEGYQVIEFSRGLPAVIEFLKNPPNLIILDLGLPDCDGVDLLKKFRVESPIVPILILTARASETDILLGFKKGADDYITKPFSPRIMLARVSALLKRNSPEILHFGNLFVDTSAMTVTGKRAPHLSTLEFQVLAYMAKKLNQPVSRIELLEEVWGMDRAPTERSIDTLIVSLRKKLEAMPSKPRYILSQRGIGYKLTQH